jgi:hypothetical protein
MTQSASADVMRDVWQYPLFEALYGRRSRRFGVGFEMTEGRFRYKSQQRPLPLSELEEALLVAAGVGVTGTPLWDHSRAFHRGEPGRTFATTSRGRRTALFFTNDNGVYVIDPNNVSAAKARQGEVADAREMMVALYRDHRKKLREGRLEIPRRVPPLFAHNLWDSNMPGATLFMPVCDVSQSLISVTARLVDREGGSFVAKHGGGMYVVDDRHGFRPAGTEKWAKSGFLDRDKVLPLSILEREACYFMFSEPAVICHNIFLATEALGVGGWMHCGFLSLEVLEALGFRTAVPKDTRSPANPVGLDGVFESYCPPYFPTMDEAVDAVVTRISGRNAGAILTGPQELSPYLMSGSAIPEDVVQNSPEGIACTKAICNYIYETYGRFPGSVDAMHLMWFMQAHHLDLDFYDRFFKAGAYGRTHGAHMALWHS